MSGASRQLATPMVTLRSITACTDWHPERVTDVYRQEDLLTWPIPVNLGDRVLWFVAELREETPWAELPGLEEIEHIRGVRRADELEVGVPLEHVLHAGDELSLGGRVEGAIEVVEQHEPRRGLAVLGRAG